MQLTSPETSVPGAMRLPGLDPARRYRVQLQPPGDLPGHMRGIHPPPWTAEGITLPGSALGTVGLRIPALFPEQLMLIRVRAVGDDQERPEPPRPPSHQMVLGWSADGKGCCGG